MTIVSILCLVIVIVALFRPPSWLLSIAFIYMSFGSLAIVPPALTGGATILAGPVAFMFLIIKLVLDPETTKWFFTMGTDPRRLGVLCLFTIIAVASALILPKVFQGEVYVFPMRNTGLIMVPEPVYPSSTNITQLLYLTISFSVACAIAALAKTRDFAHTFTHALLFGGMAVIATGLADLICSAAGMATILDQFRNASYALMTDAMMGGGVRRVTGLMPEASAFGTLAVSFVGPLLFMRHMFTPQVQNQWLYPTLFGCLTLAVLLTSSTAYLGLAAVFGLRMADTGFRLARGAPSEKAKITRELVFTAVLGVSGFFIVMFNDNMRTMMLDLLDQILFSKTSSSSFDERSSWTNQALQAWIETDGFGVGVGTARTSNFFVNILVSTGFLGMGVFLVFLIMTFATRPRKDSPAAWGIVHGAKLAVIPILVCAAASGTTPDYGVFVAALFGAVAGSKHIRKQIAINRAPGLHNSPSRKISPDSSALTG